MSAITQTNAARRHVIGDLTVRHYTVSGTDGDTLTVPQINILHVSATPTTAIDLGATWSGSVITFHTAGAWAGDVMVFAREG